MPLPLSIAHLDLLLTAAACVLWYVRAGLGPWPLLLIATGRLMRTLTLGRAAWRSTPFDGPLLLFGITAVAGAFLAYDPVAGWGKLWVIVGGLALYDSLARGPQRARLAGRELSPPRLLLAVLPAVIAGYFLLTTDWPRWAGKLAWLDPLLRWLASWQPELPGHRLHPNVAGGLIAGLLPLQVAAVGRARAGWPLIGLAAFCLLTTASRGAWIALAGAAMLWPAWRVWGRRRPRRMWAASGAGLALIGALAFVAARRPDPALFFADRLLLLRNSFDLALDTPFTGIGLAGFQMAYSSYVLMLHVGHTYHSHNLLLDIWLEQGALGLAAFAWLLGAGIRRLGMVDEEAGTAAALVSLAVIVAHGLVDDAFYGSRGALLLFVPFAALAWGASSSAARRDAPSGPPASGPERVGGWSSYGLRGRRGLEAGAAFLVIMSALVFVLIPATRAAFQANLAALLQTRAELSVYRWPLYPLQDALRRQAPGYPPPVDLAPAIGRYRVALALDPHNATANRRLGQIELSLGAYDAAARHLAAAYRVAPDQQAVRFLAGESAALAGQVAEAAALWAAVGNPEWRAGTGRQAFELRAWWYAAVGEPDHQQRITEALQRLIATARFVLQ